MDKQKDSFLNSAAALQSINMSSKPSDPPSSSPVIGRIPFQEGLSYLTELSLEDLQARAREVRDLKNPPERVTYVIDTNPNYTNVCTARCTFCAFQRLPGSSSAYTLSIDEVLEKIAQSVDLGVTTVLLQGGHHPELPLSYYESLVRETRNRFPAIMPHFFSASEIANIAEVNQLSIRQVLEKLKFAGQRTLPGGGAEILTERVRQKLSPLKISVAKWLEVHETAHRIGMRSTATMMFGHLEEDQDIVEHLEVLRQLQDKTGGFTAFIPWSYKPINKSTVTANTRSDALRYYQILAFSRCYLDNFDHIQASWFSEGKESGSEALHYGADDFGGTLFEENVHKSAKYVNHSTTDEIRKLIKDAGYTPCQRNTLYEILSP
jgi:cyclic dehypoxanthinyl futalosine synthase